VSCGWEGNRRSDVASAMRCILEWFINAYIMRVPNLLLIALAVSLLERGHTYRRTRAKSQMLLIALPTHWPQL